MQPTEILPSRLPSAARKNVYTLGATVPPPATDTAEERAARVEVAMATPAAYLIADAAEAQLAAVAPRPPPRCASCRAGCARYSAPMQCAARPRPSCTPTRSSAAAGVVPRHLRPAHPGLACSLPAAAPEPAALTDAEHYTLIYPQSAALIRACGGLPDRLDLGPPEPETVAALVHGTSPDLRAINDHPHRPTAAAA